MDVYKSRTNWMEKVADFIPGLRSYRSHEHRRDTDKRLRDYIAAHIDAIRTKVDDLKLDMTNEDKIKLLDDIERVSTKLRKLADSTRHASYGYTGVFDQVKMRDEELDKLYNYDVEILAAIKLFQGDVEKFIAKNANEKAIKDFTEKIKKLDTLIQSRKMIFDEPTELPEANN